MSALNNAFKVFLGKISTILLQFFVSIIVARELGPSGRGIYSSIIFLPSLMLALGELGITQSIIYHHGRKIIPKQQLFSSVLSLISFLSLFLIGICLIIYNTYYKKDFYISWQLIAVLQIPISLFLKTSSGFFLGEGKIGVYNKVAWIPALLNLLLNLILLSLFKLGITGALMAWILSQLFVVYYGIKKLLPYFSFTFSETSIKIFYQLLKLGIIYAVSLFIIQANYRIDIFILKSLVSYEEIGYYSIGVNLSEMLWQIPTSIGIVIISKTASNYSEKQKFIIAKSLRVSFILLLIICIIFYIIMPYFIVLAYGKNFIHSVQVSRTLFIGVLLFVFYKIINSRFAGLGKPYIALVIFIPCLALKIFGNFWLVPHWGIIGAAWASNISYSIAGLAMLIAYSKVENISIKNILTPRKDDFNDIINFIKKYVKNK